MVIRPLPEDILDCGIVVASSNNGAVQNIVKELPLLSGIDEKLRQDLVAADYFFDISNTLVTSKWNQEARAKETKTERKKVDEYWGLFSLEGGRSENMTNLLSYLELMIKDLEENYQEDPGLKNQFLKQFYRVEALRGEAQTKFYGYEMTHRALLAGDDFLKGLQEKRRENRDKHDSGMRFYAEEIRKEEETCEALRLSLEESRMRKKKVEAEIDAGGFTFGFSGLDLDAEMEMPALSQKELEEKRRLRDELELSAAKNRKQMEEAMDRLQELRGKRDQFHTNYLGWEANAKKAVAERLAGIKKAAKEPYFVRNPAGERKQNRHPDRIRHEKTSF